MNVTEAIIALLYDHDTVIVPALGAFVRHDESAQVNVITNEFQKPGSSLGFDPAQREENPLLMDYLTLHGELSDEDARQQIAAFVADSFAKMREGEAVILEGIGTLSLNRYQELEFEADPAADFNADAFGLTDFEVLPVYGAPDNAKQVAAEPTQPVVATTGEPRPEDLGGDETGGETQEEGRRRWWWLWLLLLLTLGGVALWYFYGRQPVAPEPQSPVWTDTAVTVTPVGDTLIETMNDTLAEPSNDTLAEPSNDTLAAPEPAEPTSDQPGEGTTPVEPTPTPAGAENAPTVEPGPTPAATQPAPATLTVVRPQPESKAFIVSGVFSEEQNALNMATEAIGNGCAGAFVMKRGSKFFVCYGQYPTGTAAREALPEIVARYNSKAWILIK